eukprot:GHRR01025464.1.p1 GENE.GHRR01025464.1~~GHRR01025464.1.p1  ORF type:complete len:198 (+),score=52.86 GHRR01025464.1:1619-2212(+)
MRRSLLAAARVACSQQQLSLSSVQPPLTQVFSWQQISRPYSQPAEETPIISEKVHQLADQIINLSVLECSQLSSLLRDRLGITQPAAMPMMPMGMPAAPAAAAAPEQPVEQKKEKTEFDVKLESFTPEGKIKVIKEIRAITNLGLKEAKELVGVAAGISPLQHAWPYRCSCAGHLAASCTDCVASCILDEFGVGAGG